MGGLVARAAILDYAERTQRDDVRVFVSLATPWGGSEGAAMVERAPRGFVVDSWLDMRPGSAFLESLFRDATQSGVERRLPGDVAFHLVFGFSRPRPDVRTIRRRRRERRQHGAAGSGRRSGVRHADRL
jgi:hypothetical protein